MEAGAGWFQDRLPLPPPDPAWTLVAVKIERGGVPAAVAESMPRGDVGRVIRSLDEPDVAGAWCPRRGRSCYGRRCG